MVCPFLNDKNMISQTHNASVCLENGHLHWDKSSHLDIIVPRHSSAQDPRLAFRGEGDVSISAHL